ncbi:MAG: DUF6597 domain-containing transcriptional factor, partial [Burkholderiales bacterium]
MKYCEFPAVPVLQRYVECFWSITGEQEATESKPGRVTPDGGVEIVLGFADAMRLGKLGEPLTTQPRRLIIGQLDQSADNLSKGRTDYLGIRFRPAGVYAFLAAPQHELTGRFVSLEEIAPALDRELESRLDDAQTPTVRVRVLQEVLPRHLQRAAPQSTVIEAAVRAIEETHGCITISTLMNQFDLSGRQIERLFHQYVGLSPKS